MCTLCVPKLNVVGLLVFLQLRFKVFWGLSFGESGCSMDGPILGRSYTYRPFWPKLSKKHNKKFYYNKIMKIYCNNNLFWIKGAKVEVLKLILSSVIAFLRKTACRNLSLGPHDRFSWDKVQIVPYLCSYGPKSCNFKVFI